MKITDYEKVQALAASNIFLLDGPNGTKTIAADALAKALIGLLSSKDFIGGVNLSELTQINELVSGNKLLVGTTDGNKAIAAEDALFAMLDGFAPVELRRVLFRGKNLGTALTAVQKAAIKDGSFKGMFLGDYWSMEVVFGVSLIWITGTTAVILHLPAIISLSCRMRRFTMRR